MPLTPGTRVGVYEVVGLVGAGGMGEVYRARDTRLDRAAALKTLPDEFARDPERLARFEREARTLAQLNHPHIASIYGLEAGAAPALAMEMVEGETLAERIADGPIPLDEALAIARQVAEALEHAHALGIIHRDLKPANVKAGARDGAPNVKVLDFGLAKALLPDGATLSSASAVSSPTITSPAHMTRAGVILGTAAYMAPEQARGKHVDQRADIWAFGCVLFEMITGRRAFPGEETADVLARVIQSEPDWKLIPASAPHALVTVLHRCLRKDPARRMHSIADVRIDLEEIGMAGPGAPAASPASRSWWAAALGGAAIGALVTALATLGRTDGLAPAPVRVLHLAAPLPEIWTLFRSANGRFHLAVSPDGEKLAVVAVGKDGVRRILVRRLEESEFRAVPGTDAAASVFWAPDSQRLGFVNGPAFRRVELSGAGSQQMALLAPTPGNATWGVRDEVLATGGVGRPLFRFPATGGTAAPIGDLPQGVVTRGFASWLPDDRGYLFFDGRGLRYSLLAQRSDGAPQLVAEVESLGGASVTAHYDSGYLLIARIEPSGGAVLTAQRFDLQTLQPIGQSAVVLNDLNPAFSASNTGVLAFARSPSVNERFVWLDARGATSAVAGVSEQASNFDLSPDERSIVVQPSGGGLLLHDLVRGVTTRINQLGTDPIWSPDGKRIAFSETGTTDRGIHVMPAFGGPSEVIYQAADITYLEDWSRDGKWLAGHVASGPGRPGILIPVSAGDKPIIFAGNPTGAADLKNVAESVDETHFSPDGRWLAYGLIGSGSSEVFLIPVPPNGERWQVSVAGGAQPRWRADGRALYFLTMSGTMMMVDLDLGPGRPPRISTPRTLFETRVQVQVGLDQFAVAADGKRFLVRRPDDTGPTVRPQVEVIVNWPGLLKK